MTKFLKGFICATALFSCVSSFASIDDARNGVNEVGDAVKGVWHGVTGLANEQTPKSANGPSKPGPVITQRPAKTQTPAN